MDDLNLDHLPLLGIDVGFSQSRPTTGIAWSVAGELGAARTYTDWERRRQKIPHSTRFSVIAIDGPLTPPGTPDDLARLCERLFIRGAFQTRCGDERFALSKAGKRKKFDWLYGHAVDSGVFAKLLQFIGWNDACVLERVTEERDHERRAAWICLLTAACAVVGKAEVVGEETGGWFWLPPMALWADWARRALAENRAAALCSRPLTGAARQTQPPPM